MRMLFKSLAATALAVVLATPGYAQDEDDDEFLDDILGSEETDDEDSTPSDTTEVAEERRDLLEGDVDDTVGTTDEEVIETPDEVDRRIRPIKVLQPKNFLKIGRYEVAPHLGFVTNDPFVNRYLIGAEFVYHATEVLGVGLQATFSPDFGEADYKPITEQLVEENQVSPDISKINYFANVNLQFSPIYGKVAVTDKSIVLFDVYGMFGAGFTGTRDDLEALQGTDDPKAMATATQVHPTTNFGGGVRVTFGPNIAVKLEGRSMIYIETVNSTTLEMKNNFMLLGAFSFFFPGMQ